MEEKVQEDSVKSPETTSENSEKSEEKTPEESTDSESSGNDREMHKATCAECGKEAEVPFKPDGRKPVLCKECFMKNK